MTTYVRAALAVAALLLVACNASRDEQREEPRDEQRATQRATQRETRSDTRPVVLFVGTSLTAGLGLDPDQAYPALIQRKVDSAGLDYRVVNAGVSGETSAGARQRIEWLLRQPVAVLVVETGANDGLRGIEPAQLRANLSAIIETARRQAPPPRIVLVAMEAPPNLGADYGRRFRSVYPELAREYGTTLAPFLLEGVAGVDSLNQADGIHPTAQGQAIVAGALWGTLEPILRDAAAPAAVQAASAEAPATAPPAAPAER